MSTENAFNPTTFGREREGLKIGRHGREAAQRSSSRQHEGRSTSLASTRDETNVVPQPRANRVPLRFFVGARFFGFSLDSKLANGCDPESSRLLAARAHLIVTLAKRRELVENWLDLLVWARESYGLLNPSVPLVRNRVIDAQEEIQELASALLAPMPTSRGVAMASALLSDGAGPIYNRLSSLDLGSALREVIARLNPINA
jgi:hypothetical protein